MLIININMDLKFLKYFLILVLVLSCRKENKIITLKDTKKDFDYYQWGILINELTGLKENPSEDAKTINYLKEATVVKILYVDNKISTFRNKKDKWYYVDYKGEKGWLFGSFIEIYNNFDEVLKRSEDILKAKLDKKE